MNNLKDKLLNVESLLYEIGCNKQLNQKQFNLLAKAKSIIDNLIEEISD